MRKKLILEAKAEAERFLARVRELEVEDPLVCPTQPAKNPEKNYWHPDTNWGAHINGAVKRASLDLSKALSRMRNER